MCTYRSSFGICSSKTHRVEPDHKRWIETSSTFRSFLSPYHHSDTCFTWHHAPTIILFAFFQRFLSPCTYYRDLPQWECNLRPQLSSENRHLKAFGISPKQIWFDIFLRKLTYGGTLSIRVVEFGKLQVLFFEHILRELLAGVLNSIRDLHKATGLQSRNIFYGPERQEKPASDQSSQLFLHH